MPSRSKVYRLPFTVYHKGRPPTSSEAVSDFVIALPPLAPLYVQRGTAKRSLCTKLLGARQRRGVVVRVCPRFLLSASRPYRTRNPAL